MDVKAMGDEQALRLVKTAPELTQEETREINALFPSYIFRVRREREIWTTCCRKHRVVPKGKETVAERCVFDAVHTPEPKFSFGRMLNKRPFPIPCPYCGKIGEVKELGRTGSRGNLSAYKRVVALKWYRGNLWARAYQCAKHYYAGRMCDPPEMGLVGVYRFRPGEAKQAVRSYFWWGNAFGNFSYYEQTGPMVKGKWNLCTQFSFCQEEGMHYDTIGLGAIDKSPFRYCCGAEYIREEYESLKFLTACCIYPRQIEMLMKAGMKRVVVDLAERGVRNSRAFNWEETDPMKGFNLTKQELRAFMNTKREVGTIMLYKQLRRLGEQASIEQCEQILERLYRQEKNWLSEAKRWGIRPMQLYRYFERQNKSVTSALSAWRDYIRCAEGLGYQLQRTDVLMPANLGDAHDRAAEEYRRVLQRQRDREERQRRKKEAERLKEKEKAYELRREKLERKYAAEIDGYVIIVPKNAQEILDEGRILKHCVAGYAERHIAGVTTILFMRKKKAVDKPFLTIEMNGNRLIQIHGFKNEGMYSAKGRCAPDPRETHRELLDRWLKWIEQGSKRDKNGRPLLPKKKKEEQIA